MAEMKVVGKQNLKDFYGELKKRFVLRYNNKNYLTSETGEEGYTKAEIDKIIENIAFSGGNESVLKDYVDDNFLLLSGGKLIGNLQIKDSVLNLSVDDYNSSICCTGGFDIEDYGVQPTEKFSGILFSVNSISTDEKPGINFTISKDEDGCYLLALQDTNYMNEKGKDPFPCRVANIKSPAQKFDAANKLYVDSLKPIKTSVTLLSAGWSGEGPYTQSITLPNITANNKVDLCPDAIAIQQMVDDDVIALYVENNDGALTAYAVGNKPIIDLTIQAIVTEVADE